MDGKTVTINRQDAGLYQAIFAKLAANDRKLMQQHRQGFQFDAH